MTLCTGVSNASASGRLEAFFGKVPQIALSPEA